MSFDFSWPLQQALFTALSDDPTITAEVGDGFVERSGVDLRGGALIAIGEEDVFPWGDCEGQGARHRIRLSLSAREHGFARLKQLAACVSHCVEARPALSPGHIVDARFISARARRHRDGATRVIDLTFDIIVEAIE